MTETSGSGRAPWAAVTGWPAAHSLSPAMMRFWLERAGLPGSYGVLEIPPDRFADGVRAAAASGMAGLNVTLPHKIAALSLADETTEAAGAIGAANLLIFEPDGRIRADNTDVVGVRAALAEDDETGPVVLLGAGGAARAALFHLAGQDREIRIVNRTVDKAHALAADFSVTAKIFPEPSEVATNGASLVINATSLGMAGRPAMTIPTESLAEDALVFDMVYTPLKTPLLSAAQGARLRTADGLSMLIGQARPSFAAFFGAPAPDDDPRDILVTALGAVR